MTQLRRSRWRARVFAMKTKNMDVLKAKMDKHPRREIGGRSYAGTPCLELLTLGGERPVLLLHHGYAQVNDGQGGMVMAHRAALAIATGRNYWTEPLECDHLCFTRNCCNPLHLKWEPHAVNSSAERTSAVGFEAKRAAARANGRANAAAARVAVISEHLDTGELRYHRDQLAAARELGVSQGNISACVRGKQRRAGRFAFTRYDPTDPVHEVLRTGGRAWGRHDVPRPAR